VTRLVKIGRTRRWLGRPIYRTLDQIVFKGVVVPAGHETDLVSAPFWAKWSLPNDHMMMPAIIHDFCRSHRPDLSLWDGDLLFLDAMRSFGVAEPARTLAWLAVRGNSNRRSEH